MGTEKDREFVEKARSIGFVKGFKPGATKKKVVMNEEDGKPGGFHTEHYDGSQDATAIPRPIKMKLTKEGESRD